MVLGSTCVYYVVPPELVRQSIHAGGAFDYVASHSCLWVLVVVPLVREDLRWCRFQPGRRLVQSGQTSCRLASGPIAHTGVVRIGCRWVCLIWWFPFEAWLAQYA